MTVPSGHRRYDAATIRRVVFLTRMRTAGMSISDLQRYVALVRGGGVSLWVCQAAVAVGMGSWVTGCW